jgi:hypothetical protein
MSKPSLSFPLVAFEILTNALVLVIVASIYGTGTGVFAKCLETVENDITSRGALDGMLKQRGYDRSGMLHTHVASSRCSLI